MDPRYRPTSIWLRSEDRERLREAASQCGMNVSAYCRLKLFGKDSSEYRTYEKSDAA